ncbi:MAG: uroporphyrinogen-III synthase [Ignavibacteria bacterium]|nr:uroporphyrinogen-III synthase [Ignavibacteria bacterium]
MFNKTMLVTKAKAEAEKHFESIKKEGAKLIYFPTIKVQHISDSFELTKCIEQFDKYDWIVFTSSNAVESFFAIANKRNLDLRMVKVAAVGSETAQRCKEHNLEVNLVPAEFSAAGLMKEFSKINLIDKKVFIPCSSLSRKDLNVGLAELGAKVTSVPTYEVLENDLNGLSDELTQIQNERPDIFVFTSPSSFRNYLSLLKIENAESYFSNSVICSIGKTTEAEINSHGINVNIVPELFSLRGVEGAIKKYFSVTQNIA